MRCRVIPCELKALVVRGDVNLVISRAEVRSLLDNLKTRFLETPSVVVVERSISNRMDDIIRDLWKGSERQSSGFALFAVGGYGRETVHPESDIDLLFCF